MILPVAILGVILGVILGAQTPPVVRRFSTVANQL
jgi:hypothetical protein